jgi:DNA polymerase III delta prime subunit
MAQRSPAGDLNIAINSFKKNVFLGGQNLEVATQSLINHIVKQNITTGELQAYMAKNTTREQFDQFNQMLNTALEGTDSLSDLSSDELAYILQNVMTQTNVTGAHFMSCVAGLSVGVPLIIVGVIIGISALTNATATKEAVTKDYITKKQELSDDYLNTIADLEFEVVTYEADIVYYQDEIEELQRRIDSGLYNTIEVEEMNQLIRDYTFNITDANALIAEVKVDQDYFEDKYTEDVLFLDQKEITALSEVDAKHRNAGKQAIAAGIIGGVGSFFTAVGARDCN